MVKRTVSEIMLLLLLIGIFALAFNVQPVKAEPKTIIVPDDYPTIQEAINRANLGDNIYVKSGEYEENIVINKAISLIGESADVTEIDGVFDTAVKIIASNVVVANFSINSNGGNGVEVEHSVNNTITYDEINSNGGVGLLFCHSSNNTIMQNKINSNTYVSVWVGLYSSYNVFAENKINVNLGDGIWLFGSNNTFSGDDLVVNVGVGIYLGPYSFDNILNFNSITINNGKAVDYELTAPITTCDYDGLWHTEAFTIDLIASDDKSGIFEIYYRTNSGPIQNISAYGQPFITTESANNTLEYWSVDNAGNEELPHKTLTGIKLDKTVPAIGTPSRIPKDDVQPGQEVKVSVNVTDFVSAVKNVTLSYNLNDSAIWIDFPMIRNSTTGLYGVIIPGQQANTLLRYEISAYDNAGNYKIEDNSGQYYVYTVIPEFTSTILLPLFMLTTLVATILFKKNQTHHSIKRL
jgi:parallel beta-helix repeat protein